MKRATCSPRHYNANMTQNIDIAKSPISADPFAGCVQQDVLRVQFADGSTMEGSFLAQAGMAFLHVRDGSMHGRVEGPIDASSVSRVIVLKGRDEIFEERRIRSLGEPIPGTLRRTRDGYEARLEALARAAAMVPIGRRRSELEAQFNLIADEISLAKTKRNFILAVARWNRFSNREPSKMDLSGGDMTSAERFARPRPQDFDPDPKVRRARVPIPKHVATDPRSVPNMMKALRLAGFHARPSILGETTFEEADLLVDFPGGKQKGRFGLLGRRNAAGTMVWRHEWEGNGSRADIARHRRALSRDDYRKFVDILKTGLAHAAPRADSSSDDQDKPIPGMTA